MRRGCKKKKKNNEREVQKEFIKIYKLSANVKTVEHGRLVRGCIDVSFTKACKYLYRTRVCCNEFTVFALLLHFTSTLMHHCSLTFKRIRGDKLYANIDLYACAIRYILDVYARVRRNDFVYII